jgi:DNA-binding NarL/FixJ family response regulator
MIAQSASGYLTKGCDPEEIAAAVRALQAGRK